MVTDNNIFETTMAGMTNRIAEQAAANYDRHVEELLKRNGIEWNGDILQLKKELAEKGYRLESESVESGSITNREVTITFYLTKIIDKSTMKNTFKLIIENEKEA